MIFMQIGSAVWEE